MPTPRLCLVPALLAFLALQAAGQGGSGGYNPQSNLDDSTPEARVTPSGPLPTASALDPATGNTVRQDLERIFSSQAGQRLTPDQRTSLSNDVIQAIAETRGSDRQATLAMLAHLAHPDTPLTPESIRDMAGNIREGLALTNLIVNAHLDLLFGQNQAQRPQGGQVPGNEDGSQTPRALMNGLSFGGETAQQASQPGELGVPLQAAQYALEQDPTDPAANAVVGFHQANAGNYGAAVPHFQAAVDGGRNDPRTLTYGALAAYYDGDMERAHAWAKQALRDDPAGPSAKQAEAVMKLAERKLDGAGDPPTPVRRAEAADPLDGVPPAKIRAPGAPSAPPSEPAQAAKLVEAARGAFKARDFAAAAKSAGAALAKDPEDVAALHLRAAAYARQGRDREAYADADRGLDLAHGYLPLLLTRALAANRLGNFKQGRADALEVLRRDAANPAALRLLAFAEGGLGNREAMLAALQSAALRDPAAAALLDRARALPPGSDATLLFSDAFLLGDRPSAAPQAAAPAAGRPRVSKHLIVLGVSLLSAVLAAGLIMLLGRKTDATPVAAAEADRVGPYRVIETVGAGGMGVVYKAEDPRLQRLVALKRMRPEIAADRRECERFLQEARTVSALDHPGLVRIHAIHEGPEGTFLVFEFVEGKTLSDHLGERGTLPFAEARDILAQAAEAVAYAHAKGVVHRDLKPSNIMLDASGRVRVMDFGVARAAKDALTRLTAQATIAGTPPYMSPEQEEGTTTPACDVYALGVCFYEMLTGRLPFTASGVALHQAKRAGRIPELGSAAPPGTEGVLAQALDPDPSRRFASPREFAAALGAVSV